MLQHYNNITSFSDRIHNLKLDKFPTNVILNEDEAYQLVIKTHKLSLTYILNQPSCTITLPLVKIPYVKFNIDWGDGNISSYMYNQVSTTNPVHQYTNNGVSAAQYNILIYGDFKGFDNSPSILSTTYNYLYMLDDKKVILDKNVLNNTKYYLYTINNWGNVPIESLKNFCINASGLSRLPNTELPNVNECMSSFMNCINLYKGFNLMAKNMENFKLPLNAVNCNNMFSNTHIQYDFTNINFPAYVTNIAYMFYNTQIIGINPKLYKKFSYYYDSGSAYIKVISGNYYNAFPNSVSTILSTAFDEEYFRKILSPH